MLNVNVCNIYSKVHYNQKTLIAMQFLMDFRPFSSPYSKLVIRQSRCTSAKFWAIAWSWRFGKIITIDAIFHFCDVIKMVITWAPAHFSDTVLIKMFYYHFRQYSSGRSHLTGLTFATDGQYKLCSFLLRLFWTIEAQDWWSVFHFFQCWSCPDTF